jgi:hypothetical protein
MANRRETAKRKSCRDFDSSRGYGPCALTLSGGWKPPFTQAQARQIAKQQGDDEDTRVTFFGLAQGLVRG